MQTDISSADFFYIYASLVRFVHNVIFFQLNYAGRLLLICVYVNPDYNYAS